MSAPSMHACSVKLQYQQYMSAASSLNQLCINIMSAASSLNKLCVNIMSAASSLKYMSTASSPNQLWINIMSVEAVSNTWEQQTVPINSIWLISWARKQSQIQSIVSGKYPERGQALPGHHDVVGASVDLGRVNIMSAAKHCLGASVDLGSPNH